MDLLHTFATRFTRKFPIYRLLNCALYGPHTQRELYCRSLLRSIILVVHSSLHTPHHNRWAHIEDAN